MPHKVYHGRTGIVWDATTRTVVVVMNKQVGNTTIQKRIQKHVQPSRCPEEFMNRRKSKYSKKAVAKWEDKTKKTKEQIVGEVVPSSPNFSRNSSLAGLSPGERHEALQKYVSETSVMGVVR